MADPKPEAPPRPTASPEDSSAGTRLPTRVGRALWGDNRFCGHSVAADLASTTSYWSLVSLASGGDTLDAERCAVLDDLSTCATAADPRIWPLKLIRLGAAWGLRSHGLCAGLLGLDGLNGPIRAHNCAKLLHGLIGELGPDPSDEHLIGAIHQRLQGRVRPFDGFGVAARRQDERVTLLAKCLATRGRDGGTFWRLARRVEGILDVERRTPLNIAGATAAVLCDLGFAPESVEAISLAMLLPPLLANAHEGAEQAPAVLRQLPEPSVCYVGASPRLSPRAEAAAGEQRGTDGPLGPSMHRR